MAYQDHVTEPMGDMIDQVKENVCILACAFFTIDYPCSKVNAEGPCRSLMGWSEVF